MSKWLSNLRKLGVLFAALLTIPCYGGDRLLATGGVSQIEGAGGGGLMPWALISGYGTNQQIGGALFYTSAKTKDDFTLESTGVAIGFYNRLEVSASQARFELISPFAGERIHLNTLGVKLRVIGDAIYDQDRWMPQISVGAQYKYNEDFQFIPKAVGAKDKDGVDFYIASSKLFLGALNGYNLLLNANLQATKANQFGLLGFGGDKRDRYRLYPAISAAVMLADNWLIGSELRYKPNNLSAYEEERAYDVFMTWFPHRNLSLTAAFVDLGRVAYQDNQTGWYFSGQINY